MGKRCYADRNEEATRGGQSINLRNRVCERENLMSSGGIMNDIAFGLTNLGNRAKITVTAEVSQRRI
jgi:hypothetical protein